MAVTTQQRAQVSQLYVSMFGRAPDGEGLGFWVNKMAAGATMAQVSDQMYATAPARSFYPDFLTNQEIIGRFYTNVLGRTADTEGLNYWTAKLNAAGATPGSVIEQMIGIVAGYTGTDAAGLESQKLFNNKAAVALHYGEANLGINDATTILSTVTSDAATVTAANTVIDATAAGSAGSFTLTNGTDVATASVFTAGQVYTPGGDDRINSLQDEDQLTGTAGTTDRIDATLGNANDNGGRIITPKMTGIEVINTAFTGSNAASAVFALDLQDATGQTEVNITRISQAVNAAEVGNIMTTASKLSLANTNANLTGVAEFSYGAGLLNGLNEGNLTVSNVQIGNLNIGENTSGINAFGVGSNGFETLNLTSFGAAANTVGVLNMPMDTGTDGKLVITGTADLTLGQKVNVVNGRNFALVEAAGVWVAGTGIAQAGGRIATVDASAFTGKLSIVLDNILDVGKADTSGVNQNVTIKGGKGADTFVLYDTVQAGDSIDGGDGADTLLFYSGSSLASVVTNVEAGLMLADGSTSAGLIALDYDFLPSAGLMTVRNISADYAGEIIIDGADTDADGAIDETVPVNKAEGAVRFTLTDMSPAQAAAIVIQHSTTGNGQINNSVIEAAVKANTAADLLGVTIAEGTNVDPRFNFTIDTSVANSATAPTASVSTFESVTLTDADSESNSVELQNFAQHTGTITIAGTGVAGTYLNLDVNTAAAGKDVVANAITGTSILNNAAAAGVQQGLYGLNTDGLAVDYATGNRWDAGALATEVRLGAATITAATELSNVIIRVGTNAASVNGAQAITMGSGNDTVIFDLLNDARAGLTISDTVIGGTGTDTLVIDGNATRISLGASEWTNVSAFENVYLTGNGAAAVSTLIGQNSYNLTLTDALIAANHDASGLLNIVNDNDANNDNLARVATAAPVAAGASTGENTTGTGAESAVTIDGRSLSATSHFTYNGEEGGWLDADADGLYDIGENIAGGTVDKFVFSDANVNGGNIINGGAVDNIATTWVANADVFEIRNTATATTGDLAGLSNLGIIAGSNDQATVQTLVLQLNDTVVDAMVDSYHTSTTTEQETLTVRMNNAADVTPVARAALDLDVSQTTARSIVNATLDAAGAIDNVKLGGGLAIITTFDSGVQGAGTTFDTVTVSASQFSLAAAAGTTVVATGGGIVYGAAALAATDHIVVVEGADIAGFGTALNTDTGIYYDADGNGAGAMVLIGVIVDTAVSLAAGSGLTIVA